MSQWFELYKGDPKTLLARLKVLKAAGATGILFNQTGAAANYIISYTYSSQIATTQPQT